MKIAKKLTQSLRKTIKMTCFLKTCVFPQNFPPDSQKAFLTIFPEKIHRNCERFRLKVQKNKETNYKIGKKIIERTTGDVGGSFKEHAEKISEIVFTRSPKTSTKISL